MALARQIVQRSVGEQNERPSLVASIAVEVGAEIVEGVRAPGSDLNSVDLARKFDTSRTPIREALMLLEKQGLISIPPRRRPAVIALDLPGIREIYRLRSGLLEMAAAHVAAHVTPSGLDRLRTSVADMAAAQGDLRAFVWNNVAFHDQMTTMGENRLAKSIIDSLLLRTVPLRRLSLSWPGRIGKSLDDHQRLVRAFEERDVTLAVALVRSNHRSALETVERAYAPPGAVT